MRTRHRVAVGVLWGLFLTALLTVWLWPQPIPGPTPDNFRRLYRGMTWTEVYGILGHPTHNDNVPVSPNVTHVTWKAWRKEEYSIEITFRDTLPYPLASGTLTYKDGTRETIPPSQTFAAFVCRLLGR